MTLSFFQKLNTCMNEKNVTLRWKPLVSLWCFWLSNAILQPGVWTTSDVQSPVFTPFSHPHIRRALEHLWHYSFEGHPTPLSGTCGEAESWCWTVVGHNWFSHGNQEGKWKKKSQETKYIFWCRVTSDLIHLNSMLYFLPHPNYAILHIIKRIMSSD